MLVTSAACGCPQQWPTRCLPALLQRLPHLLRQRQLLAASSGASRRLRLPALRLCWCHQYRWDLQHCLQRVPPCLAAGQSTISLVLLD